jgi:phage terminase large subunit-like protein
VRLVESWPPLILTPVPEADIARGDGQLVCETIETFCRVSKDGFAARGGDLVVLRSWQKELLGHMFARRPDGRLRHRTCLVGMPRKNGKSAIGSGLALDGLIFGGQGSDVFSCAGDKEQAKIVFTETKNMILAEPELGPPDGPCKPMKDVIEVPSTHSVYRALSSEAFTKEGLNPSRVLFDEVHVQPDRELWDVMDLAMAARRDPMIVGITTAGVMTQSDGYDTLCFTLWKYGQSIADGAVDDPSFFMAWWGAPEGADHTDPEVWRAANPGFGDLIDPDDFASKVKTTPENEFRTKRLNQWVTAKTAWLPTGAWDACLSESRLEDGADVVLGFDGSFSNDSSALVAATVDEIPLIVPLRVWERPDNEQGWRVPVLEVESTIREACQKYKVREIVFDPYLFRRTMEALEGDGLPVVEFPQTATRMIPATQRFYEAVINRKVRHDGSEVLARHLRNARTKRTENGTRVAKENKDSGRKIDAAIAAVMAFDRAAQAPAVTAPQVWSLSDAVARLQTERAAKRAGETGPPTPPDAPGTQVRPDGVTFTRF